MATPTSRQQPSPIPPPLGSAPTLVDLRVQPADEAPRLEAERSPSSRPPASAQEGETASLINAGGPPSTAYRLIAPRPGRRVRKA